MSEAEFKPVLILKQDCPFCLKLRIFLLESGLLGAVKIREFASGTDDELEIRLELVSKVEKISFPLAELIPGQFQNDSDRIVAELAKTVGIDAATLPTYQAYINGAFKRMQELYMENINLKKQLA